MSAGAMSKIRLRWHSLWPASWYLRAYLMVVLAEAAGDIAIESVLLAKFEGGFRILFFSDTVKDERAALPVYLGIFVMAHIFQILLAWEAVYNRNMLQIFGLCIFNAMFLIYAVIQISEIKQAFTVLKNGMDRPSLVMIMVIPVIIGVAEAIYIGLSYYIYRVLGWEVYKKLGADRSMKRMYLAYQVYICILKFDFFFFVAFSLQFWLLVPDQSASERYLTLGAALISPLILSAGYLAVRKEIKPLMYAMLAACVLAAGYFLFKLFRIYADRTTTYRLVFKSLTVFSALSLANLIVTFGSSIVCLRNFGKGLKERLNRPRVNPSSPSGQDDFKMSGKHFYLDSANSSRMSID